MALCAAPEARAPAESRCPPAPPPARAGPRARLARAPAAIPSRREPGSAAEQPPRPASPAGRGPGSPLAAPAPGSRAAGEERGARGSGRARRGAASGTQSPPACAATHPGRRRRAAPGRPAPPPAPRPPASPCRGPAGAASRPPARARARARARAPAAAAGRMRAAAPAASVRGGGAGGQRARGHIGRGVTGPAGAPRRPPGRTPARRCPRAPGAAPPACARGPPARPCPAPRSPPGPGAPGHPRRAQPAGPGAAGGASTGLWVRPPGAWRPRRASHVTHPPSRSGAGRAGGGGGGRPGARAPPRLLDSSAPAALAPGLEAGCAPETPSALAWPPPEPTNWSLSGTGCAGGEGGRRVKGGRERGYAELPRGPEGRTARGGPGLRPVFLQRCSCPSALALSFATALWPCHIPKTNPSVQGKAFEGISVNALRPLETHPSRGALSPPSHPDRPGAAIWESRTRRRHGEGLRRPFRSSRVNSPSLRLMGNQKCPKVP